MRLPISSKSVSASSSRHENSSTQTMREMRASESSAVTMMRSPWRRTEPARHVIHIQQPAGFLGREVAFAERKDTATRDNEQHAQLGEPGDDVFGKAIGEAASHEAFGRALHEGHYADRCAANCRRLSARQRDGCFGGADTTSRSRVTHLRTVHGSLQPSTTREWEASRCRLLRRGGWFRRDAPRLPGRGPQRISADSSNWWHALRTA